VASLDQKINNVDNQFKDKNNILKSVNLDLVNLAAKLENLIIDNKPTVSTQKEIADINIKKSNLEKEIAEHRSRSQVLF
jgi:hypothetical protein